MSHKRKISDAHLESLAAADYEGGKGVNSDSNKKKRPQHHLHTLPSFMQRPEGSTIPPPRTSMMTYAFPRAPGPSFFPNIYHQPIPYMNGMQGYSHIDPSYQGSNLAAAHYNTGYFGGLDASLRGGFLGRYPIQPALPSSMIGSATREAAAMYPPSAYFPTHLLHASSSPRGSYPIFSTPRGHFAPRGKTDPEGGGDADPTEHPLPSRPLKQVEVDIAVKDESNPLNILAQLGSATYERLIKTKGEGAVTAQSKDEDKDTVEEKKDDITSPVASSGATGTSPVANTNLAQHRIITPTVPGGYIEHQELVDLAVIFVASFHSLTGVRGNTLDVTEADQIPRGAQVLYGIKGYCFRYLCLSTDTVAQELESRRLGLEAAKRHVLTEYMSLSNRSSGSHVADVRPVSMTSASPTAPSVCWPGFSNTNLMAIALANALSGAGASGGSSGAAGVVTSVASDAHFNHHGNAASEYGADDDDEMFDAESPSHDVSASGTPIRKISSDARNILLEWMFAPEHVNRPYPTESEKKMLCDKAGMTSKQLINWFTNSRKRIWQPIFGKKARDSCTNISAEVATKMLELIKAQGASCSMKRLEEFSATIDIASLMTSPKVAQSAPRTEDDTHIDGGDL